MFSLSFLSLLNSFTSTKQITHTHSKIRNGPCSLAKTQEHKELNNGSTTSKKRDTEEDKQKASEEKVMSS
jgi:hypothetical protein